MSEVGLGPVWGPEVPLQSGLARSSPVMVQGAAGRWPEGPLAGSRPAFFIQTPELAGVKHFSGIYY